MKALLILGEGGFGRVVYELAEMLGYDRIAFLDDAGSDPRIVGCLADYAALRSEYDQAIVAIGNNPLRLEWLKKLCQAGYTLPVLVHPMAVVSPRASVGQGSVLLAGSIANTRADIGQGCILNLHAVVDHDCRVGEGCHICIGAVVKSAATVPPCTKVEANRVFCGKQT